MMNPKFATKEIETKTFGKGRTNAAKMLCNNVLI